MKSLLLTFAGILLVVAVTAGNAGRLWSQTQTPAPAVTPEPAAAPAQTMAYPKNPVKPTAESQAKAKELYQRDCAMCHGDNGNGKTDLAESMKANMGDWTQPSTLQNHDDGELFNVIRNGKGDKMPPEQEGRAKDDAVWNLVIYIRNFGKGPAATAPATTAESH
ncbi:MAG TPA: c-type cytochrome [Terracidiphilus sp.]|nr:c-type cytochrome [Terracidiphilus sp.]